MYPMYYPMDSTYLLVLIGMVIAMWAQHKVTSTFNRYKDVPTERQLTGRQAAQAILEANHIYDVSIQHVPGHLTDHYDPIQKVLRLSDSTDRSTSIAAVAVAAHECGHAVQHARGYMPLKLRSALVPVTRLGSTIAMPLILIGLLLNLTGLIQIGVIAFSAVLVFQLVTLPVEFDASRRAIAVLDSSRLLSPAEIGPAKKVLSAAALTYVAAALSSALQLLRFIMLSNRRGD